MNYILIVEDEEDIRDIYEMILRRAFPLDVVLTGSGNEALRAIQERGRPEIIISDLHMPDGDGEFLHNKLLEMKLDVPFVICSTDPISSLQRKFVGIHGYVEKPRIVDAVLKLVDTVVSSYETPPSYVPVRISFLLRLGTVHFDLFMKISESRFVKVINADEAFILEDAQRFYKKDLSHLYILKEEADQYLSSVENNLHQIYSQTLQNPQDLPMISLEAIESVERLARTLGWREGVVDASKHAVNLAIKVVSSEPNLLNLLKHKLRNVHSRYSQHVGLVALMNCAFCHQMGWVSESSQMKVGLAALMHDITVDEKIYENIEYWNSAASNPSDKTPEVVKYRNHPIESVNMLLKVRNLPADVDQIILQHHESKDGSGFPRGLVSTRISPFATVFIIVEDLINFLGDSQDHQEKIQLFIKMRSERYNSGSFKKVFDVLKKLVKENNSV